MSYTNGPDAIKCAMCIQLEKRVAALEARFDRLGRCTSKLTSMPSGVTCILPIGHDGCHEQVQNGENVGWINWNV